jgi:hypothetical protein
MDPVKKPDHYVMQAVTFGDRPSGAIAVTALRKTAVLFRECHGEAAVLILLEKFKWALNLNTSPLGSHVIPRTLSSPSVIRRFSRFGCLSCPENVHCLTKKCPSANRRCI